MSFSSSICVLLLLSLVVLLCGAQSHGERENKHHLKVLSGPSSFEERTRATSSTGPPFTYPNLVTFYNISSWSLTAGKGQTIAIVDAYGAPTAEADLASFIAGPGKGLPACTTANGCFKKVNQTGGTTYPPADPNAATQSGGWGLEVNLDVQYAHAIAPGANILLVVASSTNNNDLFAAVQYARQHANYVSMSWGGAESSYDTQMETYFTSAASTVSFFASSGDNGAGVEYPASSPNVIAVGGTTLTASYTNNLYTFVSETGWTGSGGGCSTVFSATANQKLATGYTCAGKRSVPDVSYLADPNTGVQVYSSAAACTPPNCVYIVGGTSLAAPLFAARSAISGAVVRAPTVYGSTISYRDITSGSNGYSCTVGLDLVTGLGSRIH